MNQDLRNKIFRIKHKKSLTLLILLGTFVEAIALINLLVGILKWTNIIK